MARRDADKYSRKVRDLLRLQKVPQPFRKIVVGVIGGLCLVAGLIMIIMPGPAVVFIPLGLLLLASEFPWAGRCLQKLKAAMHGAKARWRLRRRRAQSRS